MVEAAERTGDAELLLQAHHSSWSTRIWNGEFARAREHVRSGLALYDPERHRHHALMYGGHDPGVCGKGQGAVALWALGCPDQAVQSARKGIVLGQASDHLPSLLHSLWFAASVYFLRRQAADVLECSARLLALGGQHGLKLYEAIGGVFHGWARIQQRDGRAGLAELRAAVAAYATTAHVNLDLYRVNEPPTNGGGQGISACAATCCCAVLATTERQLSGCIAKQSALRRGSRPSPSNCAPRQAWRCFSATRASGMRHAIFSLRSMAGSPKASTHSI
jgi:hypothetical protein